ncbi:hypothetical protein SLE2022_013300 [Rubroshorea leprosula]
MGGKSSLALSLLVTLAFWSYCVERVQPSTVTYDHNALVIDGKRRVLLSVSIHYPRSTPEVWPELIQKSKEGGLDVIETYVFWNYHEPVRGQHYFEGRFDLVKSVKTVQEAGLFVHLRIGLYACAEWNGTMSLLCSFQHLSSDIQIQLLFLKRADCFFFFPPSKDLTDVLTSSILLLQRFPVWLHFIPGIQFRTTNAPFKKEMRRFIAKIVGLMKEESLLASQGGPIILAQVENECGNVEWAYTGLVDNYIKLDAPDPIINTCNGFYCDVFEPISPSKPKMWTESYTGWFLSFGYPIPHRPVEDIAFAGA